MVRVVCGWNFGMRIVHCDFMGEEEVQMSASCIPPRIPTASAGSPSTNLSKIVVRHICNRIVYLLRRRVKSVSVVVSTVFFFVRRFGFFSFLFERNEVEFRVNRGE